MDKLSIARLVITTAAVVLWGYGYSQDDANIRLGAIALLAVTLILRFLRRRNPRA